MRISITKLKSWDFGKRLAELHDRLWIIQEELGETQLPNAVEDALDEAFQIVTYWRDHMKTKPANSKKKKAKSVNIF